MTYVDRNLQPGETVDYVDHVSWVFALREAVALSAIAVFMAFLATRPTLDGSAAAWLLPALPLVPAVVMGIRGWILVRTSEYAVTSRRVIGKYGWLSTQSVDVLLTKVTGVVVVNTALGRVFGYGTVAVDAAGVSRQLVAMHDPQAFVSAVYKRLDDG
jgi:hypothetical protein